MSLANFSLFTEYEQQLLAALALAEARQRLLETLRAEAAWQTFFAEYLSRKAAVGR